MIVVAKEGYYLRPDCHRPEFGHLKTRNSISNVIVNVRYEYYTNINILC